MSNFRWQAFKSTVKAWFNFNFTHWINHYYLIKGNLEREDARLKKEELDKKLTDDNFAAIVRDFSFEDSKDPKMTDSYRWVRKEEEDENNHFFKLYGKSYWFHVFKSKKR